MGRLVRPATVIPMRYRPLVISAAVVLTALIVISAAAAPLIRTFGPLLAPEALFFVPTTQRAVALTIDDGPSPETTAAVLDVLRAHDARATFFLLGAQVEGNGYLVERMLRDGHEIASHGLEERPSFMLSDERFSRDLAITHERLSGLGTVHWFRPGSGLYRERARVAANRYGYHLALGDILPYDTLLPSSRVQLAYIEAWLRPGSIIILHDARDRGRRLVGTLDALIPRLRAKGYELMTLSDLARLSEDGAGIPAAPRESPGRGQPDNGDPART
jgi:peptidoglycan/xylan/chitin deacetylase (PgdA/CDA1 family)